MPIPEIVKKFFKKGPPSPSSRDRLPPFFTSSEHPISRGNGTSNPRAHTAKDGSNSGHSHPYSPRDRSSSNDDIANGNMATSSSIADLYETYSALDRSGPSSPVYPLGRRQNGRLAADPKVLQILGATEDDEAIAKWMIPPFPKGSASSGSSLRQVDDYDDIASSPDVPEIPPSFEFARLISKSLGNTQDVGDGFPYSEGGMGSPPTGPDLDLPRSFPFRHANRSLEEDFVESGTATSFGEESSLGPIDGPFRATSTFLAVYSSPSSPRRSNDQSSPRRNSRGAEGNSWGYNGTRPERTSSGSTGSRSPKWAFNGQTRPETVNRTLHPLPEPPPVPSAPPPLCSSMQPPLYCPPVSIANLGWASGLPESSSPLVSRDWQGPALGQRIQSPLQRSPRRSPQVSPSVSPLPSPRLPLGTPQPSFPLVSWSPLPTPPIQPYPTRQSPPMSPSQVPTSRSHSSHQSPPGSTQRGPRNQSCSTHQSSPKPLSWAPRNHSHSTHQSPPRSPPGESNASQTSPKSRSQTERILPKWKKIKQIGTGSFGTVHEAINLDDGSFFAVKISHDEVAPPEIQKEIELLSRLEHPNVVKYFGTDQENGHLCIFLELMQNSLQSIIRVFHHLDETLISTYTRQILQGLEYLHQKNTVHRDIKCANILIDKNGQVKLADFGLAKEVGAAFTTSCKGTPYFMAPEILKPHPKRGYGLSVDIWSLGCTVWEMADGQPPWSVLQGFSFFFKINKGELPDIPPHLSADCKDFIEQCLRFRPEERPSASELLRHKFVANAPATAEAAASVSSSPAAMYMKSIRVGGSPVMIDEMLRSTGSGMLGADLSFHDQQRPMLQRSHRLDRSLNRSYSDAYDAINPWDEGVTFSPSSPPLQATSDYGGLCNGW